MRALISVSDKTNLTFLAEELVALGFELVSTGGTYRHLKAAGLPVTSAEQVTQFPEILDGRVKTLHPNIHGGILADRSKPDHVDTLTQMGITPIHLVAVNLYPFKATIAKEGTTYEQAVENIDIGGPAMIRAAAKNALNVITLVDPADYEEVIAALKEADQAGVSASLKRRLQAKAFRHTAAYDALIGAYLTQAAEEDWGREHLTLTYDKVMDLRYGENPQQKAVYYKHPLAKATDVTAAKQLHGKELSYNNIKDMDSAVAIVREFNDPTAVAVKHMNPCGVGSGSTLEEAFAKCYAGDPVSIFGGILALNRPVERSLAEKLAKIFLEVIIAPAFSTEALELLQKKKHIRLMTLPVDQPQTSGVELVSVSGGVLVQDMDSQIYQETDYAVMTDQVPTAAQKQALDFAFKVVKHVKSNAIVITLADQTIGIGAGQMNRVGAARVALDQAKSQGFDLSQAVLASDAFFPMDDTVTLAHAYGIRAIIQPGGSIKDQDSIEACNQLGITMVKTGCRHFKH